MRAFATLVVLVACGCAPKTGWQRTTARVCDDDAPAIVCLAAEPDRAIEARVGGTSILPGECAASPKGGGRVRVELVDAHGDREPLSVRAPAAKRTTVTLRAEKKRAQVSRSSCDQRP